MDRKKYTPFALLTLLVPEIVAACWDTSIEYEISQDCQVRILAIDSELESLESESRWLNYLQKAPSSVADLKAGIPQTAREIYRSDRQDTLYCEFTKDGSLSRAYTQPSKWIELERRWVRLDRQYMELIDGLLISNEHHKSVITTCE